MVTIMYSELFNELCNIEDNFELVQETRKVCRLKATEDEMMTWPGATFVEEDDLVSVFLDNGHQRRGINTVREAVEFFGKHSDT